MTSVHAKRARSNYSKARTVSDHTNNPNEVITIYQSMTCDVRQQLAEVRRVVANCDVRAEPILLVSCDVRACGAF